MFSICHKCWLGRGSWLQMSWLQTTSWAMPWAKTLKLWFNNSWELQKMFDPMWSCDMANCFFSNDSTPNHGMLPKFQQPVCSQSPGPGFRALWDPQPGSKGKKHSSRCSGHRVVRCSSPIEVVKQVKVITRYIDWWFFFLFVVRGWPGDLWPCPWSHYKHHIINIWYAYDCISGIFHGLHSITSYPLIQD